VPAFVVTDDVLPLTVSFTVGVVAADAAPVRPRVSAPTSAMLRPTTGTPYRACDTVVRDIRERIMQLQTVLFPGRSSTTQVVRSNRAPPRLCHAPRGTSALAEGLRRDRHLPETSSEGNGWTRTPRLTQRDETLIRGAGRVSSRSCVVHRTQTGELGVSAGQVPVVETSLTCCVGHGVPGDLVIK